VRTKGNLLLNPNDRNRRDQRNTSRSGILKERCDLAAFGVDQKQLVGRIARDHQSRRRVDQELRAGKDPGAGDWSLLLPVAWIQKEQLGGRAAWLFDEKGRATLRGVADEPAL